MRRRRCEAGWRAQACAWRGGETISSRAFFSTAAHARTTHTGVRSTAGATRHAHDTRHQATTTPHSDMFALPCPADRERHMCMSLSAGKSARDLPRASALAPETDRPRPPHCCALSAARRPPVMAACSRQPTLHCTAAGAGGCSTVARVTRRARAAAGRRQASAERRGKEAPRSPNPGGGRPAAASRQARSATRARATEPAARYLWHRAGRGIIRGHSGRAGGARGQAVRAHAGNADQAPTRAGALRGGGGAARGVPGVHTEQDRASTSEASSAPPSTALEPPRTREKSAPMPPR